MPEVGGKMARTIRRLRPGTPILPPRRRPGQAPLKVKRPWYDGGPGTPALPGEPCRTPPHPDWSDNEKWVWERVCQGEVADFNDEARCQICPLPDVDEAWTGEEKERRRLSSKFLRTILTSKPWIESITEAGVRICGAYFAEDVGLEQAGPICQLGLDVSRLEGDLSGQDLKVGGPLSLQGSCLTGRLDLERATAESIVLLRRIKIKGETNLRSAKVSGQLVMSGAVFEGILNMDKLQVSSSLFMDKGARFGGEVVLRSVQIGSILALTGGVFNGRLEIDKVIVASSVFIDDGAIFKEDVTLRSTRIGGMLGMRGARFKSKLVLDSLMINDALFLWGAKFDRAISIIFSKIGGQLFLGGAKLVGLNLTGTQTGEVICYKNDWPQNIELVCFTYEYLGGMGTSSGDHHMTSWPASWFIGWLAKQKDYSPQPYEQCAKVLREAGQAGKANVVLFAGKVRERKEAWKQGQVGRWAGLWVLQTTIGHGLGAYMFLSLIWVLGLALAGTYVIHQWLPPSQALDWLPSLAYSLDMLLPFVKVAKAHESIVPTGWAGFYFYVHKLMGWLLGFFVVAGLTGLTKKS